MESLLGGDRGGRGGASPMIEIIGEERARSSSDAGGSGPAGPGPHHGDRPTSAEDFFAFLQQYAAMGGSLDPDDAPEELAPVLRALTEETGGAEGLRAMLCSDPTAAAGGGGGGSRGAPPSRNAPSSSASSANNDDLEMDDREEIRPEPGFVVKTIDDAGRKIFVNVCGHAKIAAPGDAGEWKGGGGGGGGGGEDDHGQLPPDVETALANLDDPTQTQKLRFPLSVSEGRNELDKSGAPCTVYDAVFNDDVVKQAIAFRRLKVFLVELCLQWVSQKYALSLDPKYKLPHRKYMGGDAPPPQMIRATKKKKAMIEELEEVDEEPSFPLHPKPLPKWEEKAATGGGGGGGGGGGSRAKAKDGASAATTSGLAGAFEAKAKISAIDDDARPRKTAKKTSEQPKTKKTSTRKSNAAATAASAADAATGGLPEITHEVEYVNRPVTDVKVIVNVPEGVDPNAIRAAIVMEGVTVEMPTRRPLEVRLPFNVDGDLATAEYVTTTRVLTISAPYKSYEDVVREYEERVGKEAAKVKLDSSFLEL